MTRVINIAAPDTNWHQLSVLVKGVASPSIPYRNKCSYLSLSVGGTSQTLSIGDSANATDGSISISTGAAPVVITSPHCSIALDDIYVKGGAAAAPIQVIMSDF
jgi:hypothetical protein